MSTKKTNLLTNKKPKKLTKKSTILTLTQKINNPNYKYYLIHANASRTMFVLVNHKTKNLSVYKTVEDYELTTKSLIKDKKLIQINDYTKNGENYLLYIIPKVIFKIDKYSKLFIGYDIYPMNTYIDNRKFGLGNSLLIFDGKDYFSIYYNKITKLNTASIKGAITGYISPIGNNDVPYPMMFTDTHLYSWCDNIDEYKIPDKSTKLIIDMLVKFKNPFQLPKNKAKLINNFFNKYQCNDSKIKLKENIIVSVKY